MNPSPSSNLGTQSARGSHLWLLAALVLVLGFTFSSSFQQGQALFANDGPLGAQISDIYKMPGSFLSIWSDLYWLGAYGGNYAPNATGVLLCLLGPIAFNKFLVPVALMLLGLSAALFFRQLRFGVAASVLGGLAAGLNSNFFSNACWGLSSRALSLAAAFLSLAAIQSSLKTQSSTRRIIKVVLAGLSIGLSVSEGGDNGAIFSLFIAAYAMFESCQQDGPVAGRLLKGGVKVAVMAVFAALLASQTILVFIQKDVSGTVTDDRTAMSPERRWNWATQWSLPKLESFRVIVPGLFGYRLDTPGGGDYWGGVGQEPGWEEGHKDPAWMQSHQGAFPRHSGAGEYAGVLVVLIALWALAHSLVKTGSGGSYSPSERRAIWFWGGAALVALVLSWGRHAPFYYFIFKLPYFSNVRNPMKFMHAFHMALMILFAYGLQGLWRRYLLEPVATATAKVRSVGSVLFEKRWQLGSLAALGVSILAWMVYASAQSGLTRHVSEDLGYEPAAASAIARFSAGEVGWSVFFLIVSTVLVLLIARGKFAGPKARWAAVGLGLVLVLDLARANQPWIKYYDYKEKYADNGLLQILSTRPYEHRVSMPPLKWDRNYAIFQQIYAVEWLQHQFPYYNIQSIDQPQDPRPAADKASFQAVVGTNIVRLWELTNTRFLCGMAGNFADVLNQQFDPVQRRFRLHTRFNLFQDASGNFGARVEDSGPFGLIEFTGALPRAKLYGQWQVQSDDQAALVTLASTAFNPQELVIVAGAKSAPATGKPLPAVDSVEFTRYSPKRIQLKARASAPATLLLNDRYDPNWQVRVDGRPAELLRCNFTMRGVSVPAGEHAIEFRYAPSNRVFKISLVVTVLGLALGVWLWALGRKPDSSTNVS